MPTSSTKASASRSPRTRRLGTRRNATSRARSRSSRTGLRVAAPGAAMPGRASGEDEPLLADAVLHDFVAHGAATVLGDSDEAADTEPDLLAPEQEHRVGHRPDVARRHLARDEILQPGLLGRDQ